MYGYIDESGVPGIATKQKDFLALSMIVFPNRESAQKCSNAIDELRKILKLPNTYEFHYSRNSNRPQKNFIKSITNLDFKFITIAIRKNNFRQHASYKNLVEYLTQEIEIRYKNLHIEMDANPLLYAELRRQIKYIDSHVKLKQLKSKNHNLIQLADYVVAISSRKLKSHSHSTTQFRAIAKKQICFNEIAS